MTNPTQPLFSPVTPSTDESLLSLVARSTTENVLERTSEVVGRAGLLTPQSMIFAGAHAISQLAAVLSVSEDDVRARQHPPVERGRPALMSDWYGTPLPRKFIEATARRVSPSGLRDGHYHRAVWMIRPLPFCPSSFERLISQCPHCGEALGWHRVRGPTQCDRCGRTLLRQRPGKLEWSLRDEYRHAAGLVSGDPPDRREELELLPAPFRDWEAGEVFEAIVELGHAINPNSRGRGVKSGDFTEFSAEDLVRGYRFARTWPEGLEQIVKIAAKTEYASIETLFGPLRKYLHPEASQSPLRDLVRSAAPAVLRKLGIVPSTPRSGRLLGNLPSDLGSTIGARAASELHRIDLKLLRRLQPQGHSFIMKGGQREGSTLYRADVLSEAVDRFHAAVRVDECAKLMGVPQFAVPALVEAGLLRAEMNHDANLLAAGHLLVDRSSLTGLIDAASSGARRGKAGITLSGAMTGRLHPASWVKVVGALLDGTIPLVGISKSEAALFNQLLVEQEAVDRALDRPEPAIPAGLLVSCLGAAQLLGVSDVLVNGAFHAGLLPGWRVGRGPVRIEVADLAAFAKQYVTPIEGSRMFGLTGVGFHAKMSALGFQPAGSAGKFALWHRSDAEAALAMQTEAAPPPTRRKGRKNALKKSDLPATPPSRVGASETIPRLSHLE
jgi:hypothetical protein